MAYSYARTSVDEDAEARAEFSRYEAEIGAVITELEGVAKRVEAIRLGVREIPVAKVPAQEKAQEVHKEISKAQTKVFNALKQAAQALGHDTLTPLRLIRDRCGQIAEQDRWKPGKYGY
jgi:hypothetical protein